ncbi:MAG: response regulator [Chloroflexia bacterium]|jgi:CheY-like chemotaxis protein|nr:response regulator [Chloroflexia bacterium]
MRKILVADDEEFIAILITELFQDLNYEVETVYNGRDAILAVVEDAFDLVICDLMMPYANGMDLVAAMRRHEHTRHTPIVLMSAALVPTLPDERVAFIAKPFNLEMLIDMVANRLSSRSQERLLA